MSEDLDYLTAYIIYVSMTCTLGYILSADFEHHGHHVQRSVCVYLTSLYPKAQLRIRN